MNEDRNIKIIDTCREMLLNVISLLEGANPTREISLSRTKTQEALMWLGMEQFALLHILEDIHRAEAVAQSGVPEYIQALTKILKENE